MASSVMVIRLARLGFVHNEKSLDVGLIIGLFKGDCCLCVGGPLDEKLDCSVADLLELTLDLCFEGNRPPPRSRSSADRREAAAPRNACSSKSASSTGSLV